MNSNNTRQYTIKQARLLKDMTQQEVADRLNVDVATYRRIEENPKKATIERAKALSEIFGISLDDLFF